MEWKCSLILAHYELCRTQQHGAEAVQKFFALYEIRRLLPCFKKPITGFYTKPGESSPQPIFKIRFNMILPYRLSPNHQSGLFPPYFLPKFCMQTSHISQVCLRPCNSYLRSFAQLSKSPSLSQHFFSAAIIWQLKCNVQLRTFLTNTIILHIQNTRHQFLAVSCNFCWKKWDKTFWVTLTH
jgi:hypothetical protein